MEKFSPIIKTFQIPVRIQVFPYLMDHRFDNKVVLPAVEAMQVIAASLYENDQEFNPTVLKNAEFEKFFYLEPGSTDMEAFSQVDVLENGDIFTKLQTRIRTKSGIVRTKEHVVLNFSNREPLSTSITQNNQMDESEEFIEISPQKIYEELVPFGKAFQNIVQPLKIYKTGTVADVFAGNKIEGLNLLGSPFTLDASFHAACVWSQCFLGFIAFPVSITKRVILKPTVFGNTYKAQVLPISGDKEKAMFDIFIYDRTDDICEIVTGIKMIDISGGRLRPPEWIRFSTT